MLRDTKCIPDLILKIELLETHLIKLGKRMGLKEGLIKGGKLTQARDFRIKLTEETERRLAERDENNEEDSEEEDNEDEDNSRLEDDATQTGRSTLGDITNDSRLASGPGGDVTNDSRMASGDEVTLQPKEIFECIFETLCYYVGGSW